MKTFTFVIYDNCKHSFAHQYQSEELSTNLLVKLIRETKHICPQMKSLLIREIVEWNEKPIELTRVNNVWRDIYVLNFKDYLYGYDINMINTDIRDMTFPLSEKSTFTFITHIRNYNSSLQFKVSSLEEGLMTWATYLHLLNLSNERNF